MQYQVYTSRLILIPLKISQVKQGIICTVLQLGNSQGIPALKARLHKSLHRAILQNSSHLSASC